MIKKRKNELKRIDYEIPKLHRKYTRLVDIIADNKEVDLTDILPRIKELRQQIEVLTEKKRPFVKIKKNLPYIEKV